MISNCSMGFNLYGFVTDILRQKAHEQAILLEEKMALQLKLLAASGLTNVPEPPSYCHLVAEDADTGSVWKKVISAVQACYIISLSGDNNV